MSQRETTDSESTEYTSVPVKPDVRDKLFARKRGPGDSYSDVLRRLLETDE